MWLLPLGILVYRSGFLPRALGVLVFIAGCSYVVNALTYFFLPQYARIGSLIAVIPQFAGDARFMFWMLIKGVRGVPPVDVHVAK